MRTLIDSQNLYKPSKKKRKKEKRGTIGCNHNLETLLHPHTHMYICTGI